MSKFCKKCGEEREIPQNSKEDFCEYCQNKWWSTARKVGVGIISVAVPIGGIVLMIATKGKAGGTKA
jgi:DNA-directed RNA polymerase subunit RPC12/RpoP